MVTAASPVVGQKYPAGLAAHAYTVECGEVEKLPMGHGVQAEAVFDE